MEHSILTNMMENRKQTILKLLADEAYKPMRQKDLAFFMAVPLEAMDEFQYLIETLEKEGEVVISPRGKVMLPDSLNMVKGQFTGNARGFGFVEHPQGQRDIFIGPDHVHGAMHKDIVLARLLSPAENGQRAEGEIVKVIKRGMATIVGTYEKGRKSFGFVLPDDGKINQDIYIQNQHSMGAVDGHKVVVKITKSGSASKNINPEGKIIEILGHRNDPGVDILSILRQFELPVEFPLEVMSETAAIPEQVLEEDLKGREDLRELLMVTIDGEHSKDLDDAVSLVKLAEDRYRLGVHIADVTHYVKEGSALDKEALSRGTSVYLVDRVIPMLPHKLSNGICSLNAGEDRLSLSCLMDIDGEGTVISHRIVKSVIHVDQRLVYEWVNEAMAGTGSHLSEYAPYMGLLQDMAMLSERLREKRSKRGAIEFGFGEGEILLDEQGTPVDIINKKRSLSSGIIEEFMLVCNETVAEEFFWLEAPFVYRTHEEPDREKFIKLSEFVSFFGYPLKGGKAYAKTFQKLIEHFKDTPEELIISRVALRSMKQARYTPECEGHFGLGAKYYSHFTSPIRRYPDLQIHRIIKEHLTGGIKEHRILHYNKILPEVCGRTSRTERRAEEAEREVENLKKVQYMADQIGREFEGFISSVTNWGIYVELPNTVEGMVALSDLTDDYYIYDGEHYRILGERTNKIYQLGQKVTVTVVRADTEARKIDFMFS